jgi:hypothetical protein
LGPSNSVFLGLRILSRDKNSPVLGGVGLNTIIASIQHEDSPFAAMRVFDFENQCASAGAASPSDQLPTGIMNPVKQTVRCVLIDEDQRSSLEDFGEFQRMVYTLASEGLAFCRKRDREARGDAPLAIFDWMDRG